MLQLGLLIVGMFVLQAVLSVLQMRHFSREFMKLRRRGASTPEPSSCFSLMGTG